MSMIFEIDEAEKRIRYKFKNKSLLRQAFTHSSYSNENHVQCNERLEFLGDSILNLVIAEFLYKSHPDYTEGELTKYRASVVSASPLAEAAESLNVADLMLLGQGEKRAGNKSFNIYADLFESIVGAIYLDSGMNSARKFIMFALKARIKAGNEKTDPKSKLSEYCQKNLKKRVSYVTVRTEGPPHMPMFTIQLKIGGKVISEAKADNKKAAQQQAAEAALKILQAGG